MADKRAVETLFATYWAPGGWRPDSDRRADLPAFEHAKQSGVMFEPLHVDHDEVLSRLIAARNELDPRRVADAFLVSLSTRRLELRSALGSYTVFRHAESHAPNLVGRLCSQCGLYGPSDKAEDVNVLNFERFKWGGVRHDYPLYAALDLELFLREDAVEPTAADVKVFGSILEALRSASSEATSSQVQLTFSKALKSNKAERDVIIAILGFCGVLASPEHPGYRERYIPPSARDLPNRRFVDMPYPACWWRPRDGIDGEALMDLFGHVL